ncbi:polyamine ABC transporter substrate-binding protein [Pseudohalocynthiibacter aestuariivivens]|nr:polyamine ABC transporter substrate-binding protein [Pseudohalocynthiibacter aestuariivivens]QIE45815.1 polyamine ABC transporter substrate-binding protein [Pseudohalocynthiibacter aestuariivivens]
MTTLKTQAVVTVALACLAAPSAAQDNATVNIYNWFDYFGETTLPDFEARTGIKTVYDNFDSLAVLETKMLTGNSGYDVTFPGSDYLARLIPAGAYQKLDKSKLSNLGNIAPEFLEVLTEFDPGNDYAVPYTWGTTGIAYNYAEVEARMPDAPVDSLSMVFDPEIVSKFADCGVFILDSPNRVVAAALTYLGKDPNSENEEELDAAMAVLEGVRPYLRHFNYGQVISDLANENLCLALATNGDVGLAYARAEEAGKSINIAYSIPKEGTEIFFDVMAIPTDAPNPEEAHQFINYILEPEVIASVTNYVFFANPNDKATEFVSEEVLSDPGTYPPEEVMETLYSVNPHTPKFTRLLNRAWTRMKSGQ